ncbi:MAG: KH domain-containing protein [Candidatus Diapherotrites archaeon]|nr:KH domain-containing protein [Candidatus Diapherotrites archaeon]
MEYKVVVPGELISESRLKLGQHVFIENGKIYAETVGIARTDKGIARVVALQGRYIPKIGDLVIGVVVSEEYSVYAVDVNSFYYSFIPKEEIRVLLRKGNIISAKVSKINEINEISLTNVRVLYGGEILLVEPTKVPRIIGKNASMIKLLQNSTRCSIIVGMNGILWAKGTEQGIELLKKALDKIERESHLGNLTLKIQKMLSEKPSSE